MQKPAYEHVAYWAVGAVLLYVLSLGPVVALCRHGYLRPQYCEPVYRPLELMHFYTVPVVAPALQAYVNWCTEL